MNWKFICFPSLFPHFFQYLFFLYKSLFQQPEKCRMINQPSDLPKPVCPLCSPCFVVSHFCRKIAGAHKPKLPSWLLSFCLDVLSSTWHLYDLSWSLENTEVELTGFSGRLLYFLPAIKKLDNYSCGHSFKTKYQFVRNVLFCQTLLHIVWNHDNYMRFVRLTPWSTIWFENRNYYANISVLVPSCPALLCVLLH